MVVLELYCRLLLPQIERLSDAQPQQVMALCSGVLFSACLRATGVEHSDKFYDLLAAACAQLLELQLAHDGGAQRSQLLGTLHALFGEGWWWCDRFEVAP